MYKYKWGKIFLASRVLFTKLQYCRTCKKNKKILYEVLWIRLTPKGQRQSKCLFALLGRVLSTQYVCGYFGTFWGCRYGW